MNNKRLRICLMVLFLLVPLLSAHAQMINSVVSRSMYADKKAFNEGDIITVLIVEFATGTNESNTQANSDNRTTISANTSGKFSGMLPSLGLNSQLSNRHDAKGATQTSGTLESKMTAVVTEVQDNGLLTVQGSRSVDVNGEVQITTLIGLIRPEDVTASNTVFSYNIANAQISYAGTGHVSSAAKPGIFARIWNWIF
jgi:flagellar L-ring protein FlgH